MLERFKRWLADFLFGSQVLYMDRLGREWQDRDIILEEACRQILIDFVELEENGYEGGIEERYADYLPVGSNTMLEYASMHRQIDREKQIFELYKWFKYEQPRLQLRIIEMHGQVPSATISKMEEDYREVLTENLKTLMEVRGSLWT